MTFEQLMQHLERKLGHHQFPLNPDASGIKDLFVSCALHHELALDLTREIYRRNKCQKLRAEVTGPNTIEAIAPIRLRILKSPSTDIDTFNFIEDCCATVTACFDCHSPEPRRESRREPKAKTSTVVPFAAFRSRRIKSLA